MFLLSLPKIQWVFLIGDCFGEERTSIHWSMGWSTNEISVWLSAMGVVLRRGGVSIKRAYPPLRQCVMRRWGVWRGGCAPTPNLPRQYCNPELFVPNDASVWNLLALFTSCSVQVNERTTYNYHSQMLTLSRPDIKWFVYEIWLVFKWGKRWRHNMGNNRGTQILKRVPKRVWFDIYLCQIWALNFK